jgi:hypothetical protein
VEVADGDGPAIDTGRCRNSIDTITIRSISSAKSAVSSQNTRRGISGPWSSEASTSTGSDSGTSTFTTNGSVRFSPFQKYLLGRTRTRTNVAVPGSSRGACGLHRNVSFASASSAVTSTPWAWLPRLSTARVCLPARRADDVTGTIAAATSVKDARSTTPSCTTEPAGSSLDATRSANGCSPATTSDDLGGANVSSTVTSCCGIRFARSGFTVVHPATSPRTVNTNWSTTGELLRISTWQRAAPPGATSTRVLRSIALTAIPASVPGGSGPGSAARASRAATIR